MIAAKKIRKSWFILLISVTLLSPGAAARTSGPKCEDFEDKGRAGITRTERSIDEFAISFSEALRLQSLPQVSEPKKLSGGYYCCCSDFTEFVIEKSSRLNRVKKWRISIRVKFKINENRRVSWWLTTLVDEYWDEETGDAEHLWLWLWQDRQDWLDDRLTNIRQALHIARVPN